MTTPRIERRDDGRFAIIDHTGAAISHWPTLEDALRQCALMWPRQRIDLPRPTPKAKSLWATWRDK